MAAKVANYISIGDSMSIDCYPHYDLSRLKPNVSERVGAASLLFKNVDDVWPEFERKDLSSAYPGIRFCNLAEDGATTFDFLDTRYLDLIKDTSTQLSIITITLGGNDLLQLLANRIDNMEAAVAEILVRYEGVMTLLVQALPRAVCVLSTIYDPSDGSGDLPGFGNVNEKLHWLDFLNQGIKASAKKHCALVVDTHAHFLGHGLSAPQSERWYWAPSIIEPGARGASELRRLWYDILASANLV